MNNETMATPLIIEKNLLQDEIRGAIERFIEKTGVYPIVEVKQISQPIKSEQLISYAVDATIIF